MTLKERVLLPILVCLIMFLIIPVAREAYEKFAYDNSPPLIVHAISVKDPVIARNGSITFSAVYSKRADCHPPDGYGETEFRLISVPDAEGRQSIYVFDLRRPTRWTPGQNLTATVSNPVPGDVPPGVYDFEQRSAYVCKNASRRLEVIAPHVRVTLM